MTDKEKAQKPWYKKWWVIGIGILFLIGFLGSQGGASDSGSTATTTATPLAAAPTTTVGSPAQGYVNQYGGDLSVYQGIQGMSDCDAIQAQFDIAADNNDLATPGTDQHKWTLGYMSAADDRMRSVGCY